MTPTKPNRVLGYARVSTEEQAASGLGLAVQREKITALCRLQDLELVEIVSDEGFSAATLDRPGLTRALAQLESGEVGGIVVFRLDRLTRSLSDWSKLVTEYFADRFHLISHADRIDTRSATGRMLLNITVTIGEWERQTIGERTGAALRIAASRGIFARIPYGYRRGAPTVGDTQRPAEIDPDTAEVVRRIFKLRIDGFSYHEIIAQLRKAGIPSPSGRDWVVQTLCGILAHSAYIGRWTVGLRQKVFRDGKKKTIHAKDGGQTFSFPRLAIVDLATWERVQAQHREYMRVHFPGGRQHRPSRWILSGRLACPECGGRLALTGTKSRKRRSEDERSGVKPPLQYFQCGAAPRGACSFGSKINAGRAHAAILGRLSEVLSEPEKRAKLRAAFDRHVAKERAASKTTLSDAIPPTRRLAGLDAKIARVVDLLTNGSSPALLGKLRDLEAEAATLRAAEPTTTPEEGRSSPAWRAVEDQLTDLTSALLGAPDRGRAVIDALLRGERLAIRPGDDGKYTVTGKVYPFARPVGRNKGLRTGA